MTTKKKNEIYLFAYTTRIFFVSVKQNAFQMLNTKNFGSLYVALFLERKDAFQWEEQIRQPQTKAIWPWE